MPFNRLEVHHVALRSTAAKAEALLLSGLVQGASPRQKLSVNLSEITLELLLTGSSGGRWAVRGAGSPVGYQILMHVMSTMCYLHCNLNCPILVVPAGHVAHPLQG